MRSRNSITAGAMPIAATSPQARDGKVHFVRCAVSQLLAERKSMAKLLAWGLFTCLFLASAVASATEYVTQILEPTGGRIERPKNWFYAESHQGSVYAWTLSREDTKGNRPYTTGVRIQTLVGVQAGTGKTAKQFILDFVASKKSEAKVIKTCSETDQGLFTRVCLETEEGPYHILYSLFWGSNGMDVAVVSISGTTKDLWKVYAPTFDKMSRFELIDMKRFTP